MMKLFGEMRLLFPVLVLVASGMLGANPVPTDTAKVGKKLRRGEKMLYSIEYAGINAGYAYLRVDGELTWAGGRKAYHLVNETWSNPTFSTFYRVHDLVESFVDYEYLYTLRFQKNIREGKYRHQETVEFDQENHRAHYSTGQVIEMTPESRDILISLFWARLFPLEVGKSLYIDNHTDKKNYPLEVKVYKKETLKTIFGKVECLLVEPVLRTPGLFEHKGRLWVWLTNDQRRIPVLMKSKIIIGSINAVLKEYTPGVEDK